jgi:hypothetical protein
LELPEFYGNRYRTFAADYLNAIRMGQTEPGSYIVTAFAPTEEIVGQDLPLIDQRSPLTGRAVTQRLATALEACRLSIDEYRRSPAVEIFDEAVSAGVSYELSVAISGLVKDEAGADIQISWTSADPRDFPPTTVAFTPSDFAILGRASTHYAMTSSPERVTVFGTVTLLDRSSPTSAGLFRLNVIEGSQAQKIRVRVPAHEYDLVIGAFQQGKGLVLSGRQEREGRYWWLYDAENIRVVDLPQLSLFDLDDDTDTEATEDD